MQDANGNLLFFIIDGLIFNKDGHLLAYMGPEALVGANELVIIPDPADCNRYYIFGDPKFTVANPIIVSPYYVLLDLSQVSITSTPTLPINDMLGFGFSTTTRYAYNKYAATKLRADGSRLLFFNQTASIDIVRIDASGVTFVQTITPDYFIYNFAFGGEFYSDRSELEIIETTNSLGQPIYRVGYPALVNSSIYHSVRGWVVINLDIDYNTLNLVAGSEEYTLLITEVINTNNKEANVHGIEFSSDGKTMYFIHEINQPEPNAIEYHVVGTGNNNKQPLLVNNAQDFQFTQIEVGKDGAMYFIGEQNNVGNRLAKLTNTNTPSPANWLDYVVSINYNYSDLFNFAAPSKKLYLLPDQIDGMNYAEHFTANTECCLTYASFTTGTDNPNYQQSGIQTWNTTSTGNNPFATDVITVRDELVIKTGANIVANNLTFKFAPDAKLVVETGATFTVNNCTLTVENTCENSPMWNGVDVMGPSNGQQTTAGRFIANGSTIEHSYWAVHNFKTKTGLLQEEYGPGYRGGVIIATNTTFRNNHRGMVFFDFQNTNGTTGIDDESKFYNCTFVTDALLNKPNLTPSVIMAHLFGVQGVNFYGCDFKNTASYTTIPYVDRGLGIEAYGCLFTVAPMCFDLNCTNQDKGNFTNLTRGIDASSCYGSKVNNTNFTNNWRAMYLNSTNYANITQNNVNVGANSTSWGASYGLYLESCDQYKVENNNFNTNALQNGYCGVYVKNSGTTMNEIYRNTFDKFVISTQAEGINGNGSVDVVDGKGLEFRCNTYTNTTDKDIFVSSGQIKLNHGTCDYPTSPSNNQFSRTANYDIYQVSPPAAPYYLTYVHSQPAGYNITPLIYGERVNRSDCFSPNYLTFSPTTSCPTRIRRSRTVLLEDLDTGREVVATLTSQIDDSNTKGLLILIQSQAGNGDIKDALMAASPYLSDEVLLAYIQSNPPAGNLQQVLMANSPLSDEVLAAAQQQNLPKGIKTIVNNAQTGTSAMQELQGQIAYHKNEVEKIKSEIIRYLLYEDDVEERLREIIAFLNQGDCSASQKQCYLTEFYIANKEYANATQELSALTDNIEDADYIKLFTNIIELEQTADPIQELAQNPAKQQPIIEVAEAAQRKQETARAEVMLKRAKLRNYQETIEVLNGSSLRLTNQEEQETLNSKLVTSNTITVYPNPTSNEVNITHNLNLENGKVTFKVYNMLGVEVLNENLTSTNNEVQLTNLKAGVYFYTVTQNNQAVKTDKLMVK
jgi:hypothetical protein